jgi:malonate-semialdehyde dehydrogenase (acetylating)/methylmalonate-semialdehyde dehydrogenase
MFKISTCLKHNGYSKKYFSAKVLQNFVNGQFVNSKATKFYEIVNPATNELISKVPETPKDEFNNAVSLAKEAFQSWKNVPLPTRQRYMFEYLRLLKDNQVINLLNLGKTSQNYY